MKRFSLEDAISFVDKDETLWPEKHRIIIADAAWHRIRYRADHKPAHNYDELPKVCREMLKPFLGKLPDLHITGSWLGGWWSHPEHGAADKNRLRQILGKISISDLDFWTPETSKDDALDILKPISREHDIPISWVEWWGPAMDLNTGKLRAANPSGLYKAEWSHLNAN